VPGHERLRVDETYFCLSRRGLVAARTLNPNILPSTTVDPSSPGPSGRRWVTSAISRRYGWDVRATSGRAGRRWSWSARSEAR